MSKFKPPAHAGVQVLALHMNGPDMLLWTIFCEPIDYQRDDSEALAVQLEKAAEMVRKHA